VDLVLLAAEDEVVIVRSAHPAFYALDPGYDLRSS
jgi:hypothetical protein